MDWINQTLQWYFYLFILGVIFFPITSRFFPFAIDRGYAFAKTIAILIISYLVFIGGLTHVFPFQQISIIGVGFLFAVISVIIIIIKEKSNKKKARYSEPRLAGEESNARSLVPLGITWLLDIFTKISDCIKKNSSLIIFIIFEEVLFFAALFFLAFVRGQEPSIRGLEKFMDFGFMKSILRSTYFPPLDMWLSASPTAPQGNPINYYYFGHLTGALLIKLTNTLPTVGYNLVLATIFAQAITIVFSFTINLIHLINPISLIKKLDFLRTVIFGLVGTFIVNLAGNLHTIYIFTSGYPNEKVIPFWQILGSYNPTKYWYPNATRFIPLTIHEFPSYSYVVADLHGHVFDIPFILLTLFLLLSLFINQNQKQIFQVIKDKKQFKTHLTSPLFSFLNTNYYLLTTISLGFLTAVHYMTNAFDGPIYLLLTFMIFFILFGLSYRLFLYLFVLVGSFIIFSFPFSVNFSPFVSGVGLNCAPNFLVKLQKIGPFLFEKGNCQPDQLWMLFILWGFFWICFGLFVFIIYKKTRNNLSVDYRLPSVRARRDAPLPTTNSHLLTTNHQSLTTSNIDLFILILFSFGTILILIPEFFYIKDIYPAHFRANTMFKLGYQAFIMMGIASVYTLYQFRLLNRVSNIISRFIFAIIFFLIFLYPFFSFPSYYGNLTKTPQLNGDVWLRTTYIDDSQIIDYFNNKIQGQPIILEAQGDSYTDYNRISAYTGLPTVAGWWVHEWLWRGSPSVVGDRIPDIITLYESDDLEETKKLLIKYQVQYVVISQMEKDKYKNIKPEKFNRLGKLIYSTTSGNGKIYRIPTSPNSLKTP